MAHGLTITESTAGPRAVLPASLAVIGLVATAAFTGANAGATAVGTAALNAAFPLNQPTLVTDLKAAISAAGNVGTLLPALTAITDQSSPIIIVVRVAPDADAAIETANVIGGVVDNEYTGLQALLAAQAKTGIRPRILGAPGLETAAVTAAMVVVAKRLRAMVYAAPEGDSEAAVILERANYSARELMLIWPEFSGEFEGDAVARALGLRARIDEEIGWHKTISNVAVSGVTGLTKDIHFDLLDPSTPAGLLNDNAITTIIRHNGFRFWGNRTTSDTPEYAFESAVRSLHALQDEIESAMFPFVDQPITVALIKDILETINARFRKLVRDGRIIGAEAFFDRDDNAATDLAAGRPKFRIEFTPAAPNENPNIDLIITDFYYSGFADLVNS